jgi:putative ABC transport system permease protein
VTERTREIGIRRALGAKKGDIATQFLLEAVSLTTLGGLVGIAAGLGASWGVNHWGRLPFDITVTLWALVVPFAMAVLVGIVSGLYPAIRASNLDPIVALRHE